MKSFLDLNDRDLCKIFNTVSHIIYAEMTDETRSTLRRLTYDLTREDIEFIDRELYSGLNEESSEDILNKFVSSYRLSLASNERKYSIYIIFSTLSNEVDYVLDRSVLSSDTTKLYLFAPYSIIDTNLEDENSINNAYVIIRDIFYNILNLFTDNPLFRGETKKFTAFIANNFGINIINKLSFVFAHMILDIPYGEGEEVIKDCVDYIMEGKIESSSQYIKIDINNHNQVIKDIINAIKIS